MHSDSLIINLLQSGAITVDTENGVIYSTRTGNPRKGLLNPRGYIQFCCHYNGVSSTVLAHRVVWLARHHYIPDNYQITHINRDRSDNRIANLRAVSVSERNKNRVTKYGVPLYAAKLTEEEVKEIRLRHAQGETKAFLAVFYGVNWLTIHNIVTGKTWKHCLPSAI